MSFTIDAERIGNNTVALAFYNFANLWAINNGFTCSSEYMINQLANNGRLLSGFKSWAVDNHNIGVGIDYGYCSSINFNRNKEASTGLTYIKKGNNNWNFISSRSDYKISDYYTEAVDSGKSPCSVRLIKLSWPGINNNPEHEKLLFTMKFM